MGEYEVCQCCGYPIASESSPAVLLKHNPSYLEPELESWVTRNENSSYTTETSPKIKSLERKITRKKEWQ